MKESELETLLRIIGAVLGLTSGLFVSAMIGNHEGYVIIGHIFIVLSITLFGEFLASETIDKRRQSKSTTSS